MHVGLGAAICSVQLMGQVRDLACCPVFMARRHGLRPWVYCCPCRLQPMRLPARSGSVRIAEIVEAVKDVGEIENAVHKRQRTAQSQLPPGLPERTVYRDDAVEPISVQIIHAGQVHFQAQIGASAEVAAAEQLHQAGRGIRVEGADEADTRT